MSAISRFSLRLPFLIKCRLLTIANAEFKCLNSSPLSKNRTSFCRHLCSHKEYETIDVHFDSGFFNFKANDCKYVVSFWTPLSEITKSLRKEGDKSSDDDDEEHRLTVSIPKVTFVDPSSGTLLSPNEPLGDAICDNQRIAFSLPNLGSFILDYKGSNDDIIAWRQSNAKMNFWDDDIKKLEKRKQALLSSYQPMNQLFHKILKDARSHSKLKFKWGGLFFLSAQLGFVGRLTWFEYSWDIMEPITWCLTYSMMIATFAYYNLTSQEYLLPEVEKRILRNRFLRIAKKNQFDLQKFKELQKSIKNMESRILELKAEVKT